METTLNAKQYMKAYITGCSRCDEDNYIRLAAGLEPRQMPKHTAHDHFDKVEVS